jgi:hypothetical protein
VNLLLVLFFTTLLVETEVLVMVLMEAVVGIDREAVAVVVVLLLGQPLRVVEVKVERGDHFLQHQKHQQVAEARKGLPMLPAATALTQPLTLLVEMAVVAAAPVQLPLVQVVMAVILVAVAVAAAQVTA